MVLYKYYGYNSGLAALRSRRLGFRCPNYFNDPLECSFPIDEADPRGQRLKQTLDEIRKWVVILSLTETPTDPLMWAHYGEEHRGFVIGYDEHCPFLDSAQYNLITATEGAVTYAATVALEITATYDDSTILAALQSSLGAPHDPATLEAIKPLAKIMFLTKHPRWSSEREVRVVKLLTSAFEEAGEYQADLMRSFSTLSHLVAPRMSVVSVPGLFLYDHQVPIKEVYLGARNPWRDTTAREDGLPDESLADSAVENCWVIRGVNVTASSWDLDVVDLDHHSLRITPRRISLTHRFSFNANVAAFLRDALAAQPIEDGDSFEVTTWNGELYLKKNDEFV